MINLIPPVVKKAVVREYWVRVFSVGLFMLSVVGMVVMLFALPVYVLVSSQVEVYAGSAARASEKIAEYDFSARSLAKSNQMAQKIFELRQYDSFADVVVQIEEVRGSGIAINGYEFSRKDKNLTPVIISGESLTRQALSDFRESLLKQENIEDVILPISNLAKDRDIQFSLSVVFKSEI
jgi:hypothetical protein